VPTDEGDGVVDLFAFTGVEGVHAAADPVDQVADAGDLFFGGQSLGAGPVVEFDGGPDAFAVAQEVVEVSGQVGVSPSPVTTRSPPARAGSAPTLW
jgi:hypothetical protein